MNNPIIFSNGSKMWMSQGKLHNPYGPSIVRSDGSMEFWYNGKRYGKRAFYNARKHYPMKLPNYLKVSN